MSRPEITESEVPTAFAVVAVLTMVMIWTVLIAAVSVLVVLLVMGIGHFLSRWFALTFFQAVAVSLGAMALCVVFVWGFRVADILKENGSTLRKLASRQIVLTGGYLDDEDDDYDDE